MVRGECAGCDMALHGALVAVRRLLPLVGVVTLTACGDVDRTASAIVSFPGYAVTEIRQTVTRITTPAPAPRPTMARQSPAPDNHPLMTTTSVAAPPTDSGPPLQVNGLHGQAVSALLGQPTARSAQAPGETWTYRSGSCEVNLYLFPDVAKGGMHVLDHRVSGTGGSADAEQACLRRLRQNASG